MKHRNDNQWDQWVHVAHRNLMVCPGCTPDLYVAMYAKHKAGLEPADNPLRGNGKYGTN